jgi:hypothetical protein
LAEESPWLERPRSFADLLSHADKIDPQDAELRQLFALLCAAIPEAIPGRQSGQFLFLKLFLLMDAKDRLSIFVVTIIRQLIFMLKDYQKCLLISITV